MDAISQKQQADWLASSKLQLWPVQDAAAVLGLAITLPLLRWALELAVWKPIGEALLYPVAVRSGKQQVPAKTRSLVTKLAESQWKLLCYGTFTSLGLWATLGQPWLLDTSQYWHNWPHDQMSTPMRLLYLAETAYYLATIMMLALWEVPRKDFHVMMTHHFCTVIAIIFTYRYNYTRVGVVVMLLHDINDVLMEVAKSCNYLGLDSAATGVFALFVASWAALRITAFPLCIIRSTFLEVWRILGYRPPCHGVLNALLCSLYCIHIYWFTLILRIAWRKLTTGQSKDIREDDEDEHDD